jgi:ribosomal protein S18 acetylase RimI-like enzyme
MNPDYEIIEVENNEKAVKLFAEAFKDDPMNVLIFKDESVRLEMVEAIYRFVVECIVPEQNLIMKGAVQNNILMGVIIFTEPENKREWTPYLIEEGKKLGLKTGEKYGKLIREFVTYTFRYRSREPHYYINELAVLPEYQGRGIGKMLLNYIENLSFNDKKSAGTALDTSNPDNVAFYQHLGYKVVGEFRFHGLKGFSMYKNNVIQKIQMQ